jgi:hypothetical protein
MDDPEVRWNTLPIIIPEDAARQAEEPLIVLAHQRSEGRWTAGTQRGQQLGIAASHPRRYDRIHAVLSTAHHLRCGIQRKVPV